MYGGPVTPTAPSTARLDPATLQRQIDSAIASIHQNKRGAFLVNADLSRASAALMIRATDNIYFLARITKPYSGRLEADVSGSVNFLVAPTPAPSPIGFWDLVKVFSEAGPPFTKNSIARALLKAAAMRWLNWRPYIDGHKWFENGEGKPIPLAPEGQDG